MGWVAVGMMIGAAVMKGSESRQGGKQEQAFANFRADQNEADARAERESGIVRAGKVRQRAAVDRGAARAAYAGAGIDVTRGTAEKTDQEIVQLSEEDALNEILYGERRATRLQQEAVGLRIAGNEAKRAGNAGAYTSLLETGGSMFGGGWKGGGAVRVNQRAGA